MHRVWMIFDPRRTLLALFAFLFAMALVIHGVLLTTSRFNWLSPGGPARGPDVTGVPDVRPATPTAPSNVAPTATAPAQPAAQPAAPAGLLPASVYFPVNVATLDDSARTAIAGAARFLAGDPTIRAQITGYTDPTGDLAANQELAKQRALAVRDALVAAGLPLDRIVMQPPASVEAGGSPDAARRVEISRVP